jgi:hypothetical protein
MGEGRRITCLGHHLAKLAPACRERVPVLLKMFEYGKQQHTKVEAYLKKHHPEELPELNTLSHEPPPARAAAPPAKPAPKSPPSK